jgi:hypothetical protein
LPLAENALLTMNSGGQLLLSGLIEFFHPGTFIYRICISAVAIGETSPSPFFEVAIILLSDCHLKNNM